MVSTMKSAAADSDREVWYIDVGSGGGSSIDGWSNNDDDRRDDSRSPLVPRLPPSPQEYTARAKRTAERTHAGRGARTQGTHEGRNRRQGASRTSIVTHAIENVLTTQEAETTMKAHARLADGGWDGSRWWLGWLWGWTSR